MKFKLFSLSLLFVIGVGTICSAANTHMGVEAANLVTLEWVCNDSGACKFIRSLSDGSLTDFDIPHRMVFVVTEFDWRFRSGPFPEDGPEDVLSFALVRVGSLTEINLPVRSYGTTKNVICGFLQFCKVASGTEQMTTGFVVARGSLFRPLLRNAATDSPLSDDSESLRVRVRGYLVASNED